MNAITTRHRIYFATLGALALWVGAWGTFQPTEVVRALPWSVPPLHARFLGAVYMSAAFMLALGIGARRLAEARVMVLLVTLWTGLLMVLSLVHLDAFDWNHKPVWFWFGAYALYPVVGIWWLIGHGGLKREDAGSDLPSWMRFCLSVAGVAASILAALLLFVPETMSSAWPWKISALLAQIYSAPFVAYGASFWLLARGRSWLEARMVVRGATLFAGLVIVASILHRGIFDPNRIATWVWFASFGGALVLLVGIQLRFLQRSERA